MRRGTVDTFLFMRLTVYFPEDSPTTHDFVDNKLTVGRLSDNEVQLEEGSVSSRHAEIVLQGDGAVLRDLNSTNGTFLNSEQVTGEVNIKRGDEIHFGNVRAVFEEPPAVPPAEIPAPEATTEESALGRGRPDGFRNMSPLPKKDAPKDILAIVAWGCAGLGLLAGLYALYAIFGN